MTDAQKHILLTWDGKGLKAKQKVLAEIEKELNDLIKERDSYHAAMDRITALNNLLIGENNQLKKKIELDRCQNIAGI